MMKTRNRNSALVDLDGTLADYTGSLYAGLSKIHSPNDPNLNKLLTEPDIVPEWFNNRIKLVRKQPGFWSSLPRIELGFKTLSVIQEANYTITVLTKGPSSDASDAAWTEKRKWVHKELPKIPVTITEDKGIVYGRVLFDDWPDYINSWLEWRPRGLVLMLNQPWNKNYDITGKNIVRIHSENDLNIVRVKLEQHYIRQPHV